MTSEPFNPQHMVVWTETLPHILRYEELGDIFRQFFAGHAFRFDEDTGWPEKCPDLASAIAHASWQIVKYDLLINAGEDPLAFADNEDVDLGAIGTALFDRDSDFDFKKELIGKIGEKNFAGALLYIDSLEVTPGEDVYKLSVDLIEHIIRHFGEGCFGAVYFRGARDMPDISIERALRLLGFQKIGEEPIYFANLERKRPVLPKF